ncbi:ABC-2 transporter permease [Actinocorallia populi]|uniref:ABC transporter permease subunit n=1 Tax=Actinocorallia populi TaxID=2079200 RepID=UPI000D096125|nr:ABC transporter permease subunit [Actinocorallia populi]
MNTFRHAVAAEWVKTRSLRSTVWTPLAIVPMVAGMALFVGVTESLQPDDTVLGGSLTGAVLAQFAAAVFGVLVVSGEYGSGMHRTTFTAMPRRSLVLAAKGLVVFTFTVLSAFVASCLGLWIGAWMLSGKGYSDGEPFPALFGVALCIALTALLGLAAGVLLRHSAGAITAVIGFLMLPGLFAPLFGDFQGWISGTSPQVVLQKMTQTSDVTAQNAGSLGAWPSLGLVAAYAVVLLGFAGVRLVRRDA